ncbi:MAG: histidine phosphatase family protein [Sulfuricurvum sp.]
MKSIDRREFHGYIKNPFCRKSGDRTRRKMIYLLRHFKVIDESEVMMNSERFDSWVYDYDRYELEYTDLSFPIVDKIYCSTMQRCIRSADYFQSDRIMSDELIEVASMAVFKTRIKFPKLFWLLIDRILWYFNMSKHENRCDTIQRADKFIDTLDTSKDILVISHGLFLNVLYQRLKLRGYHGNVGLAMENAYIYKLEGAK